jgi:hypothetical protein
MKHSKGVSSSFVRLMLTCWTLKICQVLR